MSLKQAQLKVKIKSLAEEAKLIRKEELKRKGNNWSYQADNLREHRIYVVRPEARSAHFAYSFIKGVPFHEIEPKRKTEPDWKRIQELIKKYASREQQQVYNLSINNYKEAA